MGQPFANVRVLDFTRFLAGPFGTYQLALLGADVVKIEPIEGEESRQAQVDTLWAGRKLSPSWLSVNGNKRSLALDLRKPQAIEIVKRLVASADVVWENFRPGVMDRLGIGYDTLAAINPTLIYCAVSGFGQSGPERTTAAFDGKMQALSGIMSITGHAETGPTRAGFALCDMIGGMTAAFAVSSALYQRTHTGKGQFVDVAMLDAALGFLAQQVSEHSVAGIHHGLAGNGSVSRKPTGNLFATGGGGLLLAVMTDRQFGNLMRTLGRPDVLDDARFIDWPARITNSAALREIIESALASDDAKAWEQKLTAADVPCSSVWEIGEVIHHPQLAHRDVLQTVDSAFGPMTLVGPAFTLAHGGGGLHHAPPGLAEHTDAILAEAGYAETDIARLRAEAVI
jgi:crotonobetainyl-CoA:carnitine CoA-transferase CaiB-like acyl-CoA transferase